MPVQSPVKLRMQRAHLPAGQTQVAIKQHLLTQVFKKRTCKESFLGSNFLFKWFHSDSFLLILSKKTKNQKQKTNNSNCGPQTSSIGMASELVGNSESHTCWESAFCTSSPGEHTHSDGEEDLYQWPACGCKVKF